MTVSGSDSPKSMEAMKSPFVRCSFARVILFTLFTIGMLPSVSAQTQEEIRAVRKARADASYLEMKGDVQQALQKYEESYQLIPDPAIEKKIVSLRAKLEKSGQETDAFFNEDSGSAKLCPGPLSVQVLNDGDRSPVVGIPVRIGARCMDTDNAGIAIFDGIPMGKYKASMQIPGFDHFETTVELKDGAREPVEWLLHPEQKIATLKGSVKVADLESPLPGASIQLIPTNVAASIQGPLSFQTNWEGNFEVFSIPVGTYEATIRAVGCQVYQQTVTITLEMPDIGFRLQRLTSDAQCELRVIDSISGKPVNNALVTLAEAWPIGIIASARSDVSGVVRFNNLRTGRVNWADREGKCTVSRSHVSVHVESEGYAATTSPLTLTPSSRASVELFPVREVQDNRANESIASAQIIDPGAIVKFSIEKLGDQDWFKIHLPFPGQLIFETGNDNPIQTYMVLMNNNGDTLQANGTYQNQVNRITAQLQRGDYLLQITEWNSDSFSTEEMTLRTAYVPVTDPLYPNSSLQEARWVRANEEFRGYQHPVSDVEYYRFEITRPSAAKITNFPAPYQRYVRLMNERGDTINAAGAYEDQPITVIHDLQPGTFFIEVSEWNRDSCSLQPNSTRLEVIEDDGFDDNPSERTVATQSRPLAVNSLVANTIFPTRDVDYYSVAIPGPGVFRTHATSVTQCYQRILRPDGTQLAACGAYREQVLGNEYHANGPETVLIEMTEWNSDDASASPYTLWNTFIPSDEYDTMGRDDLPDNAVPFAPGEVVRGTINPIRDVDIYAFHVDRPGWFDTQLDTATQLYIRIQNEKNQVLGAWGWYEGSHPGFSLPLLPGDYFMEVTEWNSDMWSPIPYALKTSYRYANFEESTVLAASPVIPLKLNETLTYKIEHLGDMDRFHIDLPAAGTYYLQTNGPIQRWIRGTNSLSGEVMFLYGLYPYAQHIQSIEVKGPTRIDIELTEWNSDAFSMDECTLMVSEQQHVLISEKVIATVDPIQPTRVVFQREELTPYPRATKLSVDADSDGKMDFEIPINGSAEFIYKDQGLYLARVNMVGSDGTLGTTTTWVDATGYRERKGLYVLLNHPRPNQEISINEPIRVSAISYSGSRINRIEATVDHSWSGSTHATPFEIEVPWDNFGPGVHTLKVTAYDNRGVSKTLERQFKVSEFYDLFPQDGAQLTGESISLSWKGRTFGPSSVRYRKAGETHWAGTIPGQNGRSRRVQLAALEPGVTYEVQPIGNTEGPIRKITRVKGLAFGKTTYASSINRDYDQRIGVSVRNHGEQPLTLQLECDPPPHESLLLAGFVGEGSEGAPFKLGPGEERDFLLGISAQDCIAPQVRFPIRIATQDGGLSDQAWVDVEVKLPNVALKWEEKGALPGGIGKVMVLKNEGDTLTDLSVGSNSTDMGIRPTISHGLLPAGHSIEFQVVPRLYEGFTEADGKLIAQAVGQSSDIQQKVALAPGQSIHAVDLGAQSEDPLENEIQRERALAAAYLNPASVDWSRKTQPADTDGDGRIDQWFVDIPEESTRWIAQDTNGDGEIDFVQGDIGPDGRSDYAAMKSEKGWQETNLVDARLEMGFTLPWARDAYEKHDADIVFNNTVVGKLRDAIPEGNYAFSVPPSAFLFNEDGSPATNEVAIKSKHLRGGHYVVSSDFRLKTNLTGTRVYTAAISQNEAMQSVYNTPGLVIATPDISVSSAEMRVVAQPLSGSPMSVSIPVRNLGSGTARQVSVALRFTTGGEDIEIGRTAIAQIAPNAMETIEIHATAPAGDVQLKLVVDPEQQLKDADRSNNEAIAPFKAQGDSEKPTITIREPKDAEKLSKGVVRLLADAKDNERIARVEVKIDEGLWATLSPQDQLYNAKSLLQPGDHQLTFRAVDTSGNVEVKQVTVTVDVKPPVVEILSPAEGSAIETKDIRIKARCSKEVVSMQARVNDGPWQKGELDDETATLPVSLEFGPVRIEIMGIDRNGIRGSATRQIQCTWQPKEEENPKPGAIGGKKTVSTDPVQVPGLGTVDASGDGNTVVTDTSSGSTTPATGGGTGAMQEETGADSDDGGDQVAADGNGAENLPVEEVEDEDGDYGADPMETEPDSDLLAELDEEESALDGEAEQDDMDLDPDEWLDDPDVDTEEDPEYALPEEPIDPDYEMPDMESWDEMPQPDAPTAQDDEDPQAPAAPPANQGFGPLPPLGDSGGYVGVQQKQSDWYCTNRPDIGVKFNMPDWLKKLYLPKPGSKEFEEMFQKRLASLKAKGVDTSQLEKLRSILKARCNRADMPSELPSFLESLGFQFGYKPKANPADLAEWREKMGNAADSFMLRLLHSNDPTLIAQGLKARMDALGQFDSAALESAQAALETVKANQQLTQDVAMAVPYLNVAVSACALGSGESLTGEKLSKLDAAFHVLTLAGPAYQLFKNPTLRQAAASIGNKAMWVGENTIGRLATKLGLTPQRVRAMVNTMKETLGNARIAAGEKLFGKAWAQGQRFMNSPAGKEAAARAARDVKQAESLIHRIAQAKAGGDKNLYRKLICKLQGNKTAQGLLNSPKYSNQFRATLDKTHRAMARLADKGTIREFMQSPTARKEIEALAKKLGVNADEIVVRARNISGNTKNLKNLKPGEMLKYGADRDVVFQYCVKGKHYGYKAVKDVHHKAIGSFYNKNLQKVTGYRPSAMDHVVTSRWNPEAYNAGLNPNTAAGREGIGNIISGKSAGKLARPSDVRDTVIHKGKEWMESGRKLTEKGLREGKDQFLRVGNQKMREGMRQMGKEYNRQVAQFLNAKGLNPNKVLPPRLKQGLDIFKKVEQGMPVEQAEEMLRALTPKGAPPVTPETIVEDLGHYIEFINKWGARAG